MDQNKNHVCPTNGGHCCECEGCKRGTVCSRKSLCVECGGSHSEVMTRYWTKHFIVLIIGIIAAFFIGYSLGKMKGYIMASNKMINFRAWPMQSHDIYRYMPVGQTVPVNQNQ